jgi:hypothetical protein
LQVTTKDDGIIEINKKGDDRISGFHRNLWNLTYHILLKYKVPVIFTVFGPNAPAKVDQYIDFFVPNNCDCAEEVALFIYDELKHHIRDGVDEQSGYMWGTHLSISLFSGIEPHLERPDVDRIVQYGVAYFNRKIAEWKEQEKAKIIH